MDNKFLATFAAENISCDFDYLPESANPPSEQDVLSAKAHLVDQLYDQFLDDRQTAALQRSRDVQVPIRHKRLGGFPYRKSFDCTVQELEIIAQVVETRFPEKHRCTYKVEKCTTQEYGWHQVVFTLKNPAMSWW